MASFRILAVDDDPIFLLLLEHVLRRIGYTDLRCVSSGDEALKIIRSGEQVFDCFLLDIEMPGMDGIELCRRIRAVPSHRRTPIVMITAMNSQHFIEAAFASGATDYITKPIDDIELKARIGMVARLVDERRRGNALEDQLHAQSGLPLAQISFDDPIPVADVGGVVEYLGLENYVLTLGRLKLFGHAAIAFKIVNASEIFLAADAVSYLDTLANVASVIVGTLKTQQFMMAYAGRGEFVCMTARASVVDPDDLKLEIAVRLGEYRKLYEELGVPLPVVRVGEPQAPGFFTRVTPLALLDRARASVRDVVARRELMTALEH
ncbi:response regulator [Fertoebacter nigrum]|uniref:Response regulator n=1 Tax=Fertoeibacter niger TaxID=2656921 RepID=A0A8X8KNB6_9RHOB|nr:response regulator [Fertoeibacter niger]NUB44825.1 response regulator [Fertoeibacter niger]